MFPSSSFKQFISSEDVDAAYGRHYAEHHYNFAPKILAVDPSWSGDDPTVIALRQGLAFRILRVIPKNDNDVQMATLIAALQDEHHAQVVFIDAGYGTGIVSAARTMGRQTWSLVGFAEKSPDPGYLNKRAWMWGQMKLWLKEGGAIPKDPELREEIVGPETVPRLDGKIQLESKEDMKARGLTSPNRADALAISFAFPVAPRQQFGLGQKMTAIMANPRNYSPLRRL